MVLAGDNLFDFELSDFVEFYQGVGHDSITTHELDELESLKKTGVIEIDQTGRVLTFEEKPLNPRSNLGVPPFYIYQKDTIPLLQEYINAGINPDAPGNFIPWLLQRKDVYAFKFKGDRYDIGTVESYDYVQEIFAQKS